MKCVQIIFIMVNLFHSYKGQEDSEIVHIEAVVGRSVELPCNVTAENEGDKINVIAWYRNMSATAFYSRDLRSDKEIGEIRSVDGPKGRYKLVSSEDDGLEKLQIINVRPSDVDLYRCFVDFESSPALKTYIQLSVIEPPQRLWVVHENGSKVATTDASSNVSENIGPYYVGDMVHLYCVAFGGKPLPSLSWWEGDQLVKDTSIPLSEVRVRSGLERGPLRREDHGRVISCTAHNNEYTPPLAIDVVVDMYLPPELVSVRDSRTSTDPEFPGVGVGRVQAGQPLPLQCRVLGSRPTPDILWRINNNPLINLQQNVTMERSQRLVVSDIELTIDRDYDEARVTCCAPSNRRGAEGYVCAQPLPLTVLYQPVVQIIVEGDLENNTLEVVKGSDLILNCSHHANPSVFLVVWYRGEDVNKHDGDQGDVSVQSILEMKNVTEADSGEYVCGASNEQGTEYSEPVTINVIYPAFCEDEITAEYGLGENESLNITCNVKGNPKPASYRWVLLNDEEDPDEFKTSMEHSTTESEEATMTYQRPNGSAAIKILCWGLNGVDGTDLPHTPCSFLITDETEPWSPTNCTAMKTTLGDIAVSCDKGHDGGLPQKFKFRVLDLEGNEELVSITSLEPKFIIKEPKESEYKFVIVASNDKGDSKTVEITKESIIDESIGEQDQQHISAVTNIATLTLALCGGVALVALAACGLVLCAHEKGSRLDLPRAASDPPLCAYATEESNCETFHDSDEGSDCNVRRTESFRRAVSRYPSSKNFDVRRTSSFHSARYMNDMLEPDTLGKCSDMSRHSNNCRVHSLQNISRKREMDPVCDHLVMHLPPETNYHVAKPMNTFYTMPRKMKSKSSRQIRDDTSEITQNSDGFSLPPPPDEFGTYRAATRIRDVPSKSIPTYTTINKNTTKDTRQQSNVIISPMNTVGLPAMSATQNSLYSYPDDDNHHRVNTNPFDEDS